MTVSPLPTGYASACATAAELLATEDPETEPYKSKYAAAEVLASARQTLEEEGTTEERGGAGGDEEARLARGAAIAVLDIRRGMALLETDLLPDGEGAIISGLKGLQVLPEAWGRAYIGLKMEAENALAGLWCNRENFRKAEQHLINARSMYEQRDTVPQQQNLPDLLGGSSEEVRAKKLESEHTLTLFLLAQVHGQQGDKAKAAEYCGACLCRQLEEGVFDRDDWLQNCVQLGGFYLGEGHEACAHYMLSAAMAQLEKCRADGQQVAEEVAANVSLGWAKFYMVRLSQAAVQGLTSEGQVEESGSDEHALYIPDYLWFDSLGVSKTKFKDILKAKTFEQARDIFNSGIRHFNEAMKVYTLDQWFTEHFEILMDISNMYRYLAVFEPDTHRKCVMHKMRIKTMEKLVKDVNQQLHKGIYRSLLFEIGNTHREICEIKLDEGRDHSKVVTAARKSIENYETFIASFDAEAADGQRIDEDSERHYIHAYWYLGSLYHKMQTRRTHPKQPLSEADAQACKRSIACSSRVVEYVKQHEVEEFREQAQLCNEMASLLKEKLSMSQ